MAQPQARLSSNRNPSWSCALGYRRTLANAFRYAALLALVGLALAPGLRADTLSGTIKDPSGAVVGGAQIEISGAGLAEPLILKSDDSGEFTAPNLSPGKYSVRVTKEGFNEIVTTVDLRGTAELDLKLTLAEQQTSINVTEKSLAFANSDATYRQLRDIGLGPSYRCENLHFTMDVGSFDLKSGTITFLNAINQAVTGAIFVGSGHFTLKPVVHVDEQELSRRAGSATRGGVKSGRRLRRSCLRFPGAA